MSIPESRVRDHFVARWGGLPEQRTPFGRIDVEFDDLVVEVEPFKRWRHGVRQALAYAHETGKRPAIAIYGDIHPIEAQAVWEKCSASGVTLVIFDGRVWRWITKDPDPERFYRMPPDDLVYRPPRRTHPDDAAAIARTAATLGVTVATLRSWPVMKEWLAGRKAQRKAAGLW